MADNTENQPAQRNVNPRLYYLGAAIMVLLGLALLNDIRKAQLATRDWTEAGATVTGNSIEREGGRRPAVYNTFIEYEFEVNGSRYTGGPVEVERNSIYTSQETAQAALDRRYPSGERISIYYDPRNPVDSSLGASHAPSKFWPLLFFLLAIAAFAQARQPKEPHR